MGWKEREVCCLRLSPFVLLYRRRHARQRWAFGWCFLRQNEITFPSGRYCTPMLLNLPSLPQRSERRLCLNLRSAGIIHRGPSSAASNGLPGLDREHGFLWLRNVSLSLERTPLPKSSSPIWEYPLQSLDFPPLYLQRMLPLNFNGRHLYN